MSFDGGKLFIKSFTDDDGTRPDGDPRPFWESPSVWLSDAPRNGQFDPGNATIRAGLPRFINILVDSNSDVPVDNAFGQAWAADPGGGPQATQPTNRTQGPNPADTFPAGDTGTVSKNSPQVVTVPWTTFEDTSNSLGDLHRCIGANVFATSSIGVPTEGINVNGAPGDPFSPQTRQKQAQRNVTLQPAAANGGQARFVFNVPNFGVQGTEYTLTVEEVFGEDSLDAIGREHVLGLRVATVTGIGTVEVQQLRNSEFCQTLFQPLERALLAAGGAPVIVDSQREYEVVPAKKRADEAVFSSASIRLKCEEDGDKNGADATVFVPTGAVVPVALDVKTAYDTQAGAVHTFQVRQWDPDGHVVGGNRFLVIGATDELLFPCSNTGGGGD
jgi:hypothetical protein